MTILNALLIVFISQNVCHEVTKHTLANKSLKTELQAKEEQAKELQEK